MKHRAEFYAKIIEWVAHPIFVKDCDFRFVIVNRAFCQMTGRRPEELIQKTDYDCFPESEADFFRAKDKELIATRRPVDVAEERITDKKGVRHILATTKVPLFDDDGEVSHIIGIVNDITKLKLADEALRQVTENLERRVKERTAALESAQEDLMRKERLAVLGQLAGGVAHQIRNPLAAIKNAAYVIDRLTKTKGFSEDERAALTDALAVIHDEVEGANQTITSLLDHARARHADRRPRDLAEIVELALASVRVPPNVAIACDLPKLPFVAVDIDQVKGALANIVQNAIEAMPSGGTVTFSARKVESAIVLEVADTGPGVAKAIRTRLFEPLVTTKPLGLGLGLVTARTILVGQGGGLEYDERDGGAVFRIQLAIA